MFNHTLLFALLLLLVGNIFTWFQINLQFMSNWWSERPIFTILLFSPCGAFFYYGWRFLVQHFDGSLWPPRLVSFGVGVIVFAVLTYIVKGEVIDKKTIVCLILSIIIILTQTLYPNSPDSGKIEDNQVDVREK
jgi:hypothetical protein